MPDILHASFQQHPLSSPFNPPTNTVLNGPEASIAHNSVKSLTSPVQKPPQPPPTVKSSSSSSSSSSTVVSSLTAITSSTQTQQPIATATNSSSTDVAVMDPENPTPSARSSPTMQRPRKNTTIDSAIHHPGSVRINVEGAFIVDDDANSPPRQHGISDGTKDIRLPHQSPVSHIAVDIGGSLAKVVYFTRDPNDSGGRLNFTNFETDNIDDCIEYMGILINAQRSSSPRSSSGRDDICVMATGGGAHKYYDKIRKALDVEIYREDEMECLIVGLDFFITEIPEEVFTYSDTDPMHFAEVRPDIYPYLLVNIGSGVSMIKVSGPSQFERVGGTSLGGGTLWGILSLLTDSVSFDEMLKMADKGDNTNVDMLVGDIYGADYGRIGLKSTTIASSFGKVFKKNAAMNKAKREKQTRENAGGDDDVNTLEDGAADEVETEEEKPFTRGPANIKNFRPEDISRSLLYAVSNNIGQIAYLQAQRHGLEHIYFGGSFIRGHRQTMHTLSYAIKFWSKGSSNAYFLRHEGYLGSVGAFLRRQPRDWGRRRSFVGDEDYPGKSLFDNKLERTTTSDSAVA